MVAQGVMAIAMSVVGLEMHHHGQDLGAISVALGVHIVGMFGLSPILGAAVDRFGRLPGLVGGLLVCAIGAVGLVLGPTLTTVLPSIFLVGVGWNLAYLAGTARVADATEPEERAASLGALDMAGLLTSASMADAWPGAPERRQHRSADARGGRRGGDPARIPGPRRQPGGHDVSEL